MVGKLAYESIFDCAYEQFLSDRGVNWWIGAMLLPSIGLQNASAREALSVLREFCGRILISCRLVSLPLHSPPGPRIGLYFALVHSVAKLVAPTTIG